MLITENNLKDRAINICRLLSAMYAKHGIGDKRANLAEIRLTIRDEIGAHVQDNRSDMLQHASLCENDIGLKIQDKIIKERRVRYIPLNDFNYMSISNYLNNNK